MPLSVPCAIKKTSAVLAAVLSLCFISCTEAIVRQTTAAPTPGVDPAQVYALKQHYESMPANTMMRIRARVLSECRIEKATRVEYLSRAQYRYGSFHDSLLRGRICIWNFEKELFEEGTYDDRGNLSGTATYWYGERLRHFRAVRGQYEIARSWYWRASNNQWTYTLVEVTFKNRISGRTVALVFSRDGNDLVSRIETGPNGKLLGLQYNAMDSKETKCVMTDSSEMNRPVPLPCPLPASDMIPGAAGFDP